MEFKGSQKFKEVLGTLVQVGLLVVFVLAALNLKVTVENQRQYRPYIFDSTYDLPAANILAAAGLNYRTAIADLVWVDAVQFVAEATIRRRTADEVTYYADAITDLDPYFHKVYSWHSAARMLVAGYPTPEDIEASNDLLEKGMKYFPTDWRLPYEAAVNYIGFNRNVSDDTRRKQLRRAVKFAEAAASIDGSPEMMILLAIRFDERLRGLEGDAEAREHVTDVDTLGRLYLMAESKPVRNSLLRRLRNHPDAMLFAETLQNYQDEFTRRFRTSSLSYVGPQLFLLLSESDFDVRDRELDSGGDQRE